jgi:hypothetical protein
MCAITVVPGMGTIHGFYALEIAGSTMSAV